VHGLENTKIQKAIEHQALRKAKIEDFFLSKIELPCFFICELFFIEL